MRRFLVSDALGTDANTKSTLLIQSANNVLAWIFQRTVARHIVEIVGDCIATVKRTFGVEALTEQASTGCGTLVDVSADVVDVLVSAIIAFALVTAGRVVALAGRAAASGVALVDILADTVHPLSITGTFIAHTRVTTWDVLTPIVKT